MTVYTVGSSGTDYTVDGTNDHVEINSALSAVAGTGDTVYLKGPLTYDIQDSILAGSDCVFMGDSTAKLKLNNSLMWETMKPVIGQRGGIGTATRNLEIYGFEIDANAANLIHAGTGSPERVWGNGYYNCIHIQGSSSNFVENINLHDLTLHDSLGDGPRITYGNNIKVSNCSMYNLGHSSIYFTEVVGGEVWNNAIQHIVNAGIRTDNSQNISIHNNDLTDWVGTTSFPKHGSNAIQIGNQPASSGRTRLTQEISIFDNNIAGGLTGICMMDALGTAGSTPQTVNVYNNVIEDSGSCTWAKYIAGISVWAWGEGLNVEYNTIQNNYGAGLLVYNAVSTGNKIYFTHNNITGTKATLATNPAYMLGVTGYGALNMVPSALSVVAENNYNLNNVSGDYYQITPRFESTTPNGDKPGSPDDQYTPERYIPPIRIIQEELTDYYIEGQPKLGYINGVPFYWQEKDIDVSRSVGQDKAPGVPGWSLTDFDFEGAELVFDCYSFSLDDLYEVIAAFYDNSRGRSKLELGGPYVGYQVRGTTTNHSSKLRLQSVIPENAHPYSILFTMDKPYMESTTKRVRSRTVYGSTQWTSDDTYAGNLIKNASFENWHTSGTLTWETETAAAETALKNVKWARELRQFCAVGDASIQISSDGDSWSIPSSLPANSGNSWRGLAWGSTTGIDPVDPENILPGRWVATSITGTGNRIATSVDGETWIERTSIPDNNWGSVCYIRDDDEGIYRYVAVAYSGSDRVMYSDDGGETWTAVASADEVNLWRTVCYSDSLKRVVALAYNGTSGYRAMYSDDYGETWTIAATPTAPGNRTWIDITWFENIGLFVAVSDTEDINQVMTSPDGETWTYQTTPIGGSTVTPGGGDIETTTYTTDTGIVYSSAATAYSSAATSLELTVELPALTDGNIYRLDQVSCQLRTALAGKTGYLKVTIQAASLYSGVETTVAEWANNTTTYIQKSLDVAIESATDEIVTLKYYMKTSDTNYRAYATLLGYKVTVTSTSDGSVSYSYNKWRGITAAPELGLLVAVAESGTGNRFMYSIDAVTWLIGSGAPDSAWQSICYSLYLNEFVSVGSAGAIMSASDYGTIQDVAPANWTYVSPGQTRSDSIAHDGVYSLTITGDGATEDRGQIKQYVSFEAGVSYVLSAWGAAEGLTHGKLAVDVFAGNSIIKQLVWDVDGDYSNNYSTIKFDVAPTDAHLRIHATDTLNAGGTVYCDDVLLCRASDFELGTTGSDIVTLGKVDVVPDVEIRGLSAGSSTEIEGQKISYVDDINTWSTATTAYSLQKTITLPAISNAAYRIDELSAQLRVSNASAFGYIMISIQATSLFGGSETPIAEYGTQSTTYLQKRYVLPYTLQTAQNEAITIKYYLRTNNATYRAYATNLGYVATQIVKSVTSGAISLYNTMDTLKVMECCNELKPLCSLRINADESGFFKYSDPLSDDSFLSVVSDSGYIDYDGDIKYLLFTAAGFLTYRFDVKFPISGVPFVVLSVINGAPQIYIAEDVDGSPGSWVPIMGNSTEVIDTAQAYRLLETATLDLNGKTKFHLKITSDNPNFLSINSIFLYADLVTIDAERPKIYKGVVNTFAALVDGQSSAVITLDYRDKNILV